jgi:hypothetical protein
VDISKETAIKLGTEVMDWKLSEDSKQFIMEDGKTRYVNAFLNWSWEAMFLARRASKKFGIAFHIDKTIYPTEPLCCIVTITYPFQGMIKSIWSGPCHSEEDAIIVVICEYLRVDKTFHNFTEEQRAELKKLCIYKKLDDEPIGINIDDNQM